MFTFHLNMCYNLRRQAVARTLRSPANRAGDIFCLECNRRKVKNGIELGIGTDGSKISDSNVSVHDVAGHDITNVTVSKSARRNRNTISNDIRRQLAQVQDDLYEINIRLVEAERALGGQWGMPGVVAKVDMTYEKLSKIDDRLASREKSWRAIVVMLSTLNVALFSILYTFWRM